MGSTDSTDGFLFVGEATAATAGPLAELLTGLRLRDFPYDRTIVRVGASVTAAEALRLLAEDATSCLLVQEGAVSHVADLTDLTVMALLGQLGCLVAQSKAFSLHSAAIVGAELGLAEAVGYLVRGWRYVCVRGCGGTSDALSQGAVLRHMWAGWVKRKSAWFAPFPCVECEPVPTVPLMASLREAFKLMLLHDSRCVCLAKADGAVAGVLSLSDIRLVARADCLADSCAAFRRRHSGKPLVQCTTTTTTLEALELMVREDVHNVVIVQDGEALGVVSAKQLLRRLL